MAYQVGTGTEFYTDYPCFCLAKLQKRSFLLITTGYHTEIKKLTQRMFQKAKCIFQVLWLYK
jgi:hypothetical protein